jgi:hypothetical protein
MARRSPSSRLIGGRHPVDIALEMSSSIEPTTLSYASACLLTLNSAQYKCR